MKKIAIEDQLDYFGDDGVVSDMVEAFGKQKGTSSDQTTHAELDRQRKNRANADKKKSIQKGKRLKMVRAMPLPLPSIVLQLWGTPEIAIIAAELEAVSPTFLLS